VRTKVGLGGSGEKYVLVLTGEDPQALQTAAMAVERDLRTIQGLGSIASTASLVRPEIAVRPEPTAVWRAGREVERIYPVRTRHTGDYARLGRFLRGKAVGVVLGGGGARALPHPARPLQQPLTVGEQCLGDPTTPHKHHLGHGRGSTRDPPKQGGKCDGTAVQILCKHSQGAGEGVKGTPQLEVVRAWVEQRQRHTGQVQFKLHWW
jgi:hypothetical protein